MPARLYFVNRIDCEDEQEKNTPLEQLVPKFIAMKESGCAMPTLLIRCAGKNADGVVNSPSSMKAIRILHKEGAPLGIHVHTRPSDDGRPKDLDAYYNPDKMRTQLQEACDRFGNVFGFRPEIFGCGDCAISHEDCARLLKEFYIKMSLGDVVSPWRYQVTPAQKQFTASNKANCWFDYSTPNWRTDFPLYKHDLWWIPAGTNGLGNNTTIKSLNINPALSDHYGSIFSRYYEISKLRPDKIIIISSLSHPPETLEHWQCWLDMHNSAQKYGFKNITSAEALDILKTEKQVNCYKKL